MEKTTIDMNDMVAIDMDEMIAYVEKVTGIHSIIISSVFDAKEMFLRLKEVIA